MNKLLNYLNDKNFDIGVGYFINTADQKDYVAKLSFNLGFVVFMAVVLGLWRLILLWKSF